ncbi:MAG: hypothetical protein IPK17_38230 [Chloroflexi bacterium]|uniref:hypothetical protein n=1 Tax=Candidatus Flexifilum breve TaxID=3140694 RepID=UPI003136926F|nr:hypothetical protein [Chloroflexota bacterium]
MTLKFREAVSPLLVSSVAGVSKVSAEGANALSLQFGGDFDPLKAVSSAYVQDILVRNAHVGRHLPDVLRRAARE